MKAHAKRRAEHKNRFRPRLEALEDRRCPTVTMSVIDGHILEVMGDRGNNVIAIESRGSQVSVMGDDAPTRTFTGIDAIRVNTWAGDDFVRFLYTDPNQRLPEFSFSADLGGGNDSFTLQCPADASTPPPDPDFHPRIDVAVQGGAGDDTFRTFVGQPELPPSAPRPHLGFGLELGYDGGAGNDSFFTKVSNVGLDGTVTMNTYGGAGTDVFRTTFGNVDINAPMTLNELGGAGRDDIRVICGFNPQPDPPVIPGLRVNAPVNVMIDGGLGGDNIAVICGFNPQPDPPAFPAFEVTSRFQLDVLGGGGNDILTGTLLPAVQRGGSFAAMFDGGQGNDSLTGILVPAVQRDGSFMASFDGGQGGDMLTGILLPAVQRGGSIDVAFMGGQGNDFLGVHVDLSQFTPESGRLHVAVDGGNGSDHVVFLVNGGTDRPLENALFTLDGGAGEDFAVVSALVHVRNVEHVEIV